MVKILFAQIAHGYLMFGRCWWMEGAFATRRAGLNQRRASQGPGRNDPAGVAVACSGWLNAADRMRHPMAQEFSRRSIAGFVAGMLVATVLTVMGTYYVLHRFVLDNPADPLTKAGGLQLGQKVK
jgi:hypothetical protein